MFWNSILIFHQTNISIVILFERCDFFYNWKKRSNNNTTINRVFSGKLVRSCWLCDTRRVSNTSVNETISFIRWVNLGKKGELDSCYEDWNISIFIFWTDVPIYDNKEIKMNILKTTIAQWLKRYIF